MIIIIIIIITILLLLLLQSVTGQKVLLAWSITSLESE